jgi:hypothetical protein
VVKAVLLILLLQVFLGASRIAQETGQSGSRRPLF